MRKHSLIGITALLLALVSGCSGQNEADQKIEQEKTKIVEVMTIKQQGEQATLSLIGIVEPNQSASLSFNSNGQIMKLHVKNGDLVKAGQVVGTLDTTLSASESLLAKKQMEEANASKHKLLEGPEEEVIEQQKLKIVSAKRNYEKAQKDLQIGEQLLASGAVSKNEVDQLKNQANHGGYNIDLVSLISLSLSMGLIVDAGIVVLESIYHFREKGEDLKTSIIRGVKEVLTPVLTSQFTIVIVFLPLVFANIGGAAFVPIMMTITFTVTVAILSSTIAALFFVPVFCEQF